MTTNTATGPEFGDCDLDEAKTAISQGHDVEHVFRKLDGSYDTQPCWLDEGVLVMSHPTRPTGEIECPTGRHYRIAQPESALGEDW